MKKIDYDMGFGFMVIFPKVSHPLHMSYASLLTSEKTQNLDACSAGYSNGQ